LKQSGIQTRCFNFGLPELTDIAGMKLIDTHTHIFVKEFDEDLEQVVFRAGRAGVEWMLLPNIDVESVEKVKHACRLFPELKPMWGLHPCHIDAQWKENLEKIRPLFKDVPAVAVGEIGLDFYWSTEFAEEQKKALEIQLGWALEENLPVSLHTRNATRETIDLVQPFAQKGLKGVFHCFSGTEEEAREIGGMGLMLGIGGSLTYPKNPIREFIGKLPPELLVLETDAPYLPPVPYRGKRNEPAYLKEVLFALSDFFEIPPARIAEITSANAVSLFNL
jgi:TatD DNase family protein